MHNDLRVQNNNSESTIAIARCWVSGTVHQHHLVRIYFLLPSLVATEDWTEDFHWTAAAKRLPSRRARCFLSSGRKLRRHWSPESRRCRKGIWSNDTWTASPEATVTSKLPETAAKLELFKLLGNLTKEKSRVASCRRLERWHRSRESQKVPAYDSFKSFIAFRCFQFVNDKATVYVKFLFVFASFVHTVCPTPPQDVCLLSIVVHMSCSRFCAILTFHSFVNRGFVKTCDDRCVSLTLSKRSS